MELEGIRYSVISEKNEIEKYVISVCEEEWDPEDFDDYGKKASTQWSTNSVFDFTR